MNVAILLLCLLPVQSHLFGKAGLDVPLANPPAAISQEKLNQQLTDAILAGSVDEVKKAIAAGADINYMDHDGKTPAWLALLIGKFDIVLQLLEFGAKGDVTYRGNTFAEAILDKASRSNSIAVKCMALLVLNGVDFSNVKKGGTDITDFVIGSLEKGLSGSVNQLKSNALELVQQLINHGYKIIDKMWDRGDIDLYSYRDIIALCLKNGININQSVNNMGNMHHIMPLSNYKLLPMPALFIAIRLTTPQAIESLLDAGANMDFPADPDGKGMQTPLDWALSNGSSEAIRILMKRGAKTYKQLQNQ